MESKLTNEEIARVFAMYFPNANVTTPDGDGKLVGLPMSIMQYDRVNVHFGKNMVHTKNSIDGGYDKKRNHGHYAIEALRYEPIGSEGITEDGFDMPGGVKLLLTPLEDITDEHAIEVSEILGGASHLSKESIIFQTKELICSSKLYSSQTNISGIKWFFCFQYLVQKGYNVPIFFGVDHLNNGKSLIELNIAIKKQ